ncbi:hypothetical protein F5Y15DRAFT_345475 [Xylariaceae sp. FL0016]|nr:hypothetical protein F5Y15DRAFT_345475 [Xylariaceae sp. FL0016]
MALSPSSPCSVALFLRIDALGLLFGAPLADMNHTHMYNPRWPPHAKFHNGQTITLSVMLGIATMYYTWRKPLSPAMRREFMTISAITGSIYWLAGLAAILYPGTMGLDPEFGGPGFPQAPLFTGFAVCGLLGSLLGM